MRTSSDLGLQVLVDLAEDRRDRRAEHAQDAHSSDGDERQDERVLHHCLTLFAIAKGREREVCPHRDRLRPLHLVPPFGLPEEPAWISATEFASLITDRPVRSDRLPLEGWVRLGPWSRLEVGVDGAEDVARVVADRAQDRESSSRDEHEDERVFDERLPLLI